MLFEDNIVVEGKSSKELNRRFENRRKSFKGKGLRISQVKTEYIEYALEKGTRSE